MLDDIIDFFDGAGAFFGAQTLGQFFWWLAVVSGSGLSSEQVAVGTTVVSIVFLGVGALLKSLAHEMVRHREIEVQTRGAMQHGQGAAQQQPARPTPSTPEAKQQPTNTTPDKMASLKGVTCPNCYRSFEPKGLPKVRCPYCSTRFLAKRATPR